MGRKKCQQNKTPPYLEGIFITDDARHSLLFTSILSIICDGSELSQG